MGISSEKSASTTATIRAFELRDQAAARNVILEGMREHWGTLDPTLNRDLDDIGTSYANGAFMVAEYDASVVATGALVPRDADRCEIVRMSTLRDLRRRGIGRQLLDALLTEARRCGYGHLRLATNADWHDAIAFYERCGLIRIYDERRPREACFKLTL